MPTIIDDYSYCRHADVRGWLISFSTVTEKAWVSMNENEMIGPIVLQRNNTSTLERGSWSLFTREQLYYLSRL